MSSLDSSKPKNLLLIMSDEHNKRFMGCSGNSLAKTPRLDGIAATGARFSNAYCNNPICLPSRASFTIGDYASRHSYWDNAFPYAGETKGFGHRLIENGIRVVTIGKLHFKDDRPETGFPDQRIPLHSVGGVGDLFGSARSYEQARPELADRVLSAHWGDSSYLRYDMGITDQAIRFLTGEAKDSPIPWFLQVGFTLPHLPLVAPEEYRETYPLDKIELPKNYRLSERPSHPVIQEIRRYMGVEGEFPEDDVRRAIAVYYGLCSQLDAQIGEVLEALRKSGLEDTTRIIYASDHGDQVGAHGLWWKHTLYEESVGVPLLMSGPDICGGCTIDDNVSLIDLYPTVLDCFDIELTEDEKSLPGVSLLPAAQNRDTLPVSRPVYAEYFALASTTGGYMLRKDNFKLCYYAYYPCQLFDLEADPEESFDLAKDPEYSQIVEDLEAELRKIVDPERMSLQCRIEQLDKLDEHGGYRSIIKNGPQFTESPVPKQFH